MLACTWCHFVFQSIDVVCIYIWLFCTIQHFLNSDSLFFFMFVHIFLTYRVGYWLSVTFFSIIIETSCLFMANARVLHIEGKSCLDIKIIALADFFVVNGSQHLQIFAWKLECSCFEVYQRITQGRLLYLFLKFLFSYLIQVVGKLFFYKFISSPSLALFILLLFFLGHFQLLKSIFLAVGFSHDSSNSFEHFEEQHNKNGSNQSLDSGVPPCHEETPIFTGDVRVLPYNTQREQAICIWNDCFSC